MKRLKTWFVVLLAGTVLSGFLTFSHALIPYTSQETVNIRQESLTKRRGVYFYGPARHRRSPLGGGLGYGK